MTIIVLTNAPENLRGELTKWLLEVKAGVFLGNCSKTVRDELWDKVNKILNLNGLLIYSYNNEQGYNIEMCGFPDRAVINMDGLLLIEREI